MFKVSPTTLYILETKNGWITNLIYLHLLNIPIYQLQAISMPHVFILNYHPFKEQIIQLLNYRDQRFIDYENFQKIETNFL
jgi:hypothetical protein